MNFESLQKLQNKRVKQQVRKEIAQETTGWKGFGNKTKNVAAQAFSYRPATVKYVDEHLIALDDKVEVMNQTFSKQLSQIMEHLGLENNESQIAEEVATDMIGQFVERVNTVKENVYSGHGMNYEMEMIQTEIRKFEKELEDISDIELNASEFDDVELGKVSKRKQFIVNSLENLYQQNETFA